VKFNPEYIMKAQKLSKMYSYTISLTSALIGVGGQGDAPTALPPGERAGSHCVVGRVDSQGRSVLV